MCRPQTVSCKMCNAMDNLCKYVECTNILYKPWDPVVYQGQQLCYQAGIEFTYCPVLVSFKTGVLFNFRIKLQQVNILMIFAIFSLMVLVIKLCHWCI